MSAPVVALLGATDPLGEAILQLLGEGDIKLGEIVPLDFEPSEACARFLDQDIPVQAVGEVDFSRIDILVCAKRTPAVRPVIELAMGKGCRVVALDEMLAEDHPRAVGVPAAASQALQRVLTPIAKQVGVEDVDVVVLAPMSLAGQAGVDELAGQTRALFAMEAPESAVFPVRIAFNLIPQVGPQGADGSTAYEAGIAVQTRRLLGAADVDISVTAVWTPIFHGGAMVVHGRAGQPLELGRLRKWLSRTDGVTLMDTPLPGGVPTPATDALESEDVFVGRLRVRAARRFSLWLILDMTRLEAARIVDAVEKMIENQADSMLP